MFPDLSIQIVAPLLRIDTSVGFFTRVVIVSFGICLLFSVTAKKEPSKTEPKEKVKVTKLFTFLVNRGPNFRVIPPD